MSANVWLWIWDDGPHTIGHWEQQADHFYSPIFAKSSSITVKPNRTVLTHPNYFNFFTNLVKFNPLPVQLPVNSIKQPIVSPIPIRLPKPPLGRMLTNTFPGIYKVRPVTIPLTGQIYPPPDPPVNNTNWM